MWNAHLSFSCVTERHPICEVLKHQLLDISIDSWPVKDFDLQVRWVTFTVRLVKSLHGKDLALLILFSVLCPKTGPCGRQRESPLHVNENQLDVWDHPRRVWNILHQSAANHISTATNSNYSTICWLTLVSTMSWHVSILLGIQNRIKPLSRWRYLYVLLIVLKYVHSSFRSLIANDFV